MKELFFRTVIILLGSIGVLGVGRISISHWTGEASCPMIGSLPACYIILIGYSLIVLSMYPRLQQAFLLFLVGWVPVILLALTACVDRCGW
jgi:cell division protein FtsX